VDDEAGYREFAATRVAQLLRIAYLLCGDVHEAQDLVQTCLAKMYAAWPRIRDPERVDAYARQVLTRAFLSSRRLKRNSEIPMGRIPDTPADFADPDLRLALLEALRALPPRGRAVVVLRYLEDHSVETVAGMLDLSVPAVRSLNTRALAALRGLLSEERGSRLRP
jgi:RNA polymerase sigma-70 factor (sigma-E family)